MKKTSIKIIAAVVVVAVIAAALLLFANNRNANDNTASQPPSKTQNILTSSENSLKDGETLVVYFSAQGHTKDVAEQIAEDLNADIFEIVPATPYSDDYDAVVDLAQAEQSEDARPAIADSIENIADYDVIYVGYPNWWGDMPMILYTFFDSYDFSGKTVAPFCTSGGSGLSDTVNAIKELEPNAAVTEGLHIGSSASSNPDDAVSEWLSEIGLAK